MVSCDIQITLASGGVLPAYFAPAKGTDRAAGIVLLQEIFGINANMREITEEYAAHGFNAIAPDLFWRQEPGVRLDPGRAADRERATAFMKGMDQALAVDDALAAAMHLLLWPNATSKVGAVGYCLGGELAYLLSARQGIDAAVSYYGVGIQAALDKADAIRCPLLLHIAEEDHLCPPPQRKRQSGRHSRRGPR